MVSTRSLFSQIVSLFDRQGFAHDVEETKAERSTKGFRCWDQLVAMVFCQLAQAKSLREIRDGLKSCLGKLNHLGLEKAPGHSTLAYANEHRPCDLYEKTFYRTLGFCRGFAPQHKFRFRNKLLSLDATLIDLCASMFDWAKYTRAKGAAKLHLLLDHDGYLPCFALVTEGKRHEVNVARTLKLPKESIVVMDRGYNDYGLFEAWDEARVYFVTRMKSNASYTVEADLTPEKRRAGLISDQVVRMNGMDRELRRVEWRDKETGKVYVFLTNHFSFAASTIAAIYRERWHIETFFRTLKQNLRIKTFVGTSANAVRIQIWTALLTMLLIQFMRFRSTLGWVLAHLVALLRWNLFSHRDLWTWLDDPFQTPPDPGRAEQLPLNLDSIKLA